MTTVNEVIDELETVTAGRPHWIYRGENQTAGRKWHKRVLSGVARWHDGIAYLPETGLDEWALAAHDAVYTDLASKYGDPREKEEVLCEAEMHGGRTTLINFTRNVFKALFFAALDLNDGDADNDGRVVIFDAKQRLEPGANVFNPDAPYGYYVAREGVDSNVAVAQESVLVYGHVAIDTEDNDNVSIVRVPGALREAIIEWLDSEKGITFDRVFPRSESYANVISCVRTVDENVTGRYREACNVVEWLYGKKEWQLVKDCVEEFDALDRHRLLNDFGGGGRIHVMHTIANYELGLKSAGEDNACPEMSALVVDNCCCHNEDCIDRVGRNRILKTLEHYLDTHSRSDDAVSKVSETRRVINSIKKDSGFLGEWATEHCQLFDIIPKAIY